jgi:hypothetical protein
MRVFFVVACLASFALVAEAAISSTSPEAAVRAAYAADAFALWGAGPGVMSDQAARERVFSRSLLRAIEARETEAQRVNTAAGTPADPFSDSAPQVMDLRITPISEDGASAKVLAEFARGDGGREQLTYSLVFERREWRIDDIKYSFLNGVDRTLRTR